MRFLADGRDGLLPIDELTCDTDGRDWMSGPATIRPSGFFIVCGGKPYFSPDWVSVFSAQLEVEPEIRSKLEYELYEVIRYDGARDRLSVEGPIELNAWLKKRLLRVMLDYYRDGEEEYEASSG